MSGAHGSGQDDLRLRGRSPIFGAEAVARGAIVPARRLPRMGATAA